MRCYEYTLSYRRVSSDLAADFDVLYALLCVVMALELQLSGRIAVCTFYCLSEYRTVFFCLKNQFYSWFLCPEQTYSFSDRGLISRWLCRVSFIFICRPRPLNQASRCA